MMPHTAFQQIEAIAKTLSTFLSFRVHKTLAKTCVASYIAGLYLPTRIRWRKMLGIWEKDHATIQLFHHLRGLMKTEAGYARLHNTESRFFQHKLFGLW